MKSQSAPINFKPRFKENVTKISVAERSIAGGVFTEPTKYSIEFCKYLFKGFNQHRFGIMMNELQNDIEKERDDYRKKTLERLKSGWNGLQKMYLDMTKELEDRYEIQCVFSEQSPILKEYNISVIEDRTPSDTYHDEYDLFGRFIGEYNKDVVPDCVVPTIIFHHFGGGMPKINDKGEGYFVAFHGLFFYGKNHRVSLEDTVKQLKKLTTKEDEDELNEIFLRNGF